MKRILSLILTVTLMISLLSAQAYADGTDLAVATAGIIAAAEEFYEASVIAQMVGRAGAATSSGSKGIAFEILYKDVENCKMSNIVKGVKTSLSESSINQVADLVKVDKNTGDIVEFIQCKAGSEEYVEKVLKNVGNGKYKEATLVGTKEFAENYNAKAATSNVKTAVNSGISNKRAEKIAIKALGEGISQSQIMKTALKGTGIGALTGGAISVAESIINKTPFPEAASDTVIESISSGLSIGIGTLAAEEFQVLAAALGMAGTGVTISQGIIFLIVPTLTGYIIHIVIEETQVDEYLTEFFANVKQISKNAFEELKKKFEEMNIKVNYKMMKYNFNCAVHDFKHSCVSACNDVIGKFENN